MSNACLGCPFVQKCTDKVAVLEGYVNNIESVIAGYSQAEVEHSLKAEQLNRSLPSNWLKRLLIKDDIQGLKEWEYKAYENAKDYFGIQQKMTLTIKELLALAEAAPSTCVDPDFRLGRLVCSSRLNTFKNRRKL